MDLNNNIKSIIYQFYTYSESQIEEFKADWKNKMFNVNKIFKITIADYLKECFVCTSKLHRNCECNKFYFELNLVNSLVLK